MPIIAIALIIAAALGGGTAFAAQTALPGDALWGFKTTINENIQGALQADTKAKADWDIAVAEDRLGEAKQLAADGHLNAAVQAQVQANFDAHASDVAQLIAQLKTEGRTSDAAEVATHFQAMLAAKAPEVSAAASTTVGASLLSDLRAKLDSAATMSADASDDAQAEATTSDDGDNHEVQIHTGTSVRGGQGGIQTTGDGSVVGI